MLMALLYTEDNYVAAAGPACDVLSAGSNYWTEYHPSKIEWGTVNETAIVNIQDIKLSEQLSRLGLDRDIDGFEIARIVELLGSHRRDLRDAA